LETPLTPDSGGKLPPLHANGQRPTVSLANGYEIKKYLNRRRKFFLKMVESNLEFISFDGENKSNAE